MTIDKKYTRALYACFLTSLSNSATGNLSPLLFMLFRTKYGLSYSLLGLLIVVNFTTQLLTDLIFSFYSHKFDLIKSLKLTPVCTVVGLVLYAVLPVIFPEYAYVGLVIGTVVFSAGSGLSEVLTSPAVAAIPSENPERLMSRLHSCYAWGVVFVVVISTVFLRFAGGDAWFCLPLFFTIVPLVASLLFVGAPMPELGTTQSTKGSAGLLKNRDIALCLVCIFFGGASECAMAQWCSGYLESALGIEKLWGDLFGVAVFSAMLGLGRSLYGYFGKNVERFMFFGAVGAAVCYITAVVASIPVVGLVACALTGFCVSMLWPGSLIALNNRVDDCGVACYAFMAAGGDLGGSVVPQLVGIIADVAIAVPALGDVAASLSLTSEEAGMKAGMAFASIFPIGVAIVMAILIKRQKIKKRRKQNADTKT